MAKSLRGSFPLIREMKRLFHNNFKERNGKIILASERQKGSNAKVVNVHLNLELLDVAASIVIFKISHQLELK